MSATITLDAGQAGRDVDRTHFVRRGGITFGTYATGGVAVTKASFDLWHSLIDLRVDSAGGYIPKWDKTNAKVLLYWGTSADDAVLEEIDDALDVSATSFRFRAEGL